MKFFNNKNNKSKLKMIIFRNNQNKKKKLFKNWKIKYK